LLIGAADKAVAPPCAYAEKLIALSGRCSGLIVLEAPGAGLTLLEDWPFSRPPIASNDAAAAMVETCSVEAC
jgi:hypothetical protein